MKRLYSFTPSGMDELVISGAPEFVLSQTFNNSFSSLMGADGAWDDNGDISPYGLSQMAFAYIYPKRSQYIFDKVRSSFSRRGVLKVYMDDHTMRQTYFKAASVQEPIELARDKSMAIVISGVIYPYWRALKESSFEVPVVDDVMTGGFHTLGSADVLDSLSIEITPTADPVTHLDISNEPNGYSFTWDGTLSFGETLIVIPAICSAKIGSTNEYHDMTPGADQVEFMRLSSGVNVFLVTYTGGQPLVTVKWRDTWH